MLLEIIYIFKLLEVVMKAGSKFHLIIIGNLYMKCIYMMHVMLMILLLLKVMVIIGEHIQVQLLQKK